MPQSVDITGFGKVNFPDNFSPADIQQAIERDIVPNMKGTAFQKANASLEATGKVGFRADQKPGQEFVPGAYVQGGAPIRPKLYQAPEPAPEGNLGAAIKDNIAADEGTRLRLIAQEIFPGDPKGIDRVGIRNGKPVFVNDEGKLQYVSGTGSNILGGLIGNAPEIAGGIAGSFTPYPVAGATAGSMLGKALKRGVSNLVFDEPVTPASLGKEVAIEGAINLAGAGAGKILGKVVNTGRVVDFSPARLAQAEQTIQYLKQRTGIDLDLAQASGDRRLIALRDYAARYPGETAGIIQAADEAAAGQFNTAVRRVLDVVASPAPAGQAGQKAINAAEETITQARRLVSQKVAPLYDAAYASVPEITDVALLNYLKLPYFDEAFKAGQTIAALERKSLPPGTLPDLRSFDYLKQGLDHVIQGLKDQAGRPTKLSNALTERKKEFVAQLDNLSGDLYKQARAAYAQGIQQTVTPLEDGFVGSLAKLSPQDAATAARIFTDPSMRAEEAALLKAKISQTDPDAYKGLVRQFLSDKFNAARGVTQGADETNVPGKFYQSIAKTPDDRDKLKALLPAGSDQLLQDVLLAAEKLAATPLGASRVAGSNTLRDQTISEMLKSRTLSTIRAISQPIKSVIGGAEYNAREQGIKDLTEALVDPAKRDQLKRIVKISDPQRKLIELGTLFGTKAAAGAAQDLTENVQPGPAPGRFRE